MPRPWTATLLAPSSRAATGIARHPSRLFTTTPPSRSALFKLGGLAASREGQYLSKETGIPRTEFSSNIHLIRSSEVDPFAPAPGASPQPNNKSNNNTSSRKPPRPTSSPIVRSRQQQADLAKPITYDALVEEHKQNKEALRDLRLQLQQVHETTRSTGRWITGVFVVLTFVTFYRWGSEKALRERILALEAEASLNKPDGGNGSVNHQPGQGAPGLEAAPVVLAAGTQEQQKEQQEPGVQEASAGAGGTLQWLRSFFWASGAK